MKRRGISHYLQALVLIGIVAVVGGFLIVQFTNYTRSQSTLQQFVVTDAKIIYVDGTTPAAQFIITIRNMGSMTIQQVVITEQSGTLLDTTSNPVNLVSGSIEPGKSITLSTNLDPASVDITRTYLIIVQVTYIDGSQGQDTVEVTPL